MNSWFTGNDDRPGLDPDPEHAHLEQMHCANCGALIERVQISVYIEPFCQVLVCCSEICGQDVQAKVEDRL
jgi:hypothetical protein